MTSQIKCLSPGSRVMIYIISTHEALPNLSSDEEDVNPVPLKEALPDLSTAEVQPDEEPDVEPNEEPVVEPVDTEPYGAEDLLASGEHDLPGRKFMAIVDLINTLTAACDTIVPLVPNGTKEPDLFC